MTAQEAIKQLQTEHDLIANERELDGSQFAPELLEALAMAIEALSSSEIPNNSDTISRQAAIDAINTWDKFGVDERSRVVRWHEGLEPYVHLRDVVAAIGNLPPAQPEIIRCKDCKYFWHSGTITICGKPQKIYSCSCLNTHAKLNGYCDKAERRTDE